MRLPRIYLNQDLASALENNTPVCFDDNARRHIVQVLRLKPGAPMILFNGLGGEYGATLEQVDRRQLTASVHSYDSRSVESPLQITLAQGISRGERMDYTLQKATEIGVQHIVPLITERCGVHLNSERQAKRLQHWHGITVAACEQCGRNSLPTIQAITLLTQWLGESPKPSPLQLVLDPGAGVSIGELAKPANGIILLIGPEGGLGEDEIEQARRHGYQPVSIGPRILRTETAGVATLAIIQALWGDI